MSPLRFLKPWSLYNPGEVAGFDSETAATLIGAGVAVEAEETPAAKPALKKGKKPAADVAPPEGEDTPGEAQGGAEPASDAG
jgi:hypothetical protein